MAISDRIKFYRKKNNLTQSQLAELVGVSPQAISKWEMGVGYPDSYSYMIEWPCVQELLPELRGKKILDFGCGTGIFTFLLEKYYPSKIVGIDLSEEMLTIAIAKGAEKQSSAQFVLGDASKLANYFDEKFDLVFSSTTTHYLANLDELFENISCVLSDEGVCILSIIHPVYSALYPIEHGETFPTDDEWVVRYLDKSKRAYIQPWIEYNDNFENQLSRSYHYTISDYVNAIQRAGLKIQEIKEPMPLEVWKSTSFGRYNNYIETPTYMIFKLSK